MLDGDGVELAHPADDLIAAQDARAATGVKGAVFGCFKTVFVRGTAEQGDDIGLEIVEIDRAHGGSPLLGTCAASREAADSRGFHDAAVTILEADAAFKDANTLLLALMVVQPDRDQATPQRRAHHRQGLGNRVIERDGGGVRGEDVLDLRIDEGQRHRFLPAS